MFVTSNNWARLQRRSAHQLHLELNAVLEKTAFSRLLFASSVALSTATTLLAAFGPDIVSSQLSLQILVLSGYELFYLWLAETLLQHPSCQRGGGAPSKAGPSRGGRAALARDEPGDHPEKPTAKKRKRNDKDKGKGKKAKDNNGNEDSDDSDDGLAVPPLAGQPRARRSSKPLMACPFFRLDPERYFACADCDLRGYDAVKQHMERNHRGSFYCPQRRCFSFFKTAEKRDTHIRGGCSTDVPGHDHITDTEWDAVFDNPADRCIRTYDDVTKYLWMWSRLFRGHTPPTRDEVLLQNLLVEGKKFMYGFETILSVLETQPDLLLNQLPARALAGALRGAFLAANPLQRYRVYHPGYEMQANNGEGTSGSSSNAGPGPQVGSGADAAPADAGAELLRPVAQYLGAPLPEQAPLGHGDASSSLVSSSSAMAGLSAVATCTSAEPAAPAPAGDNDNLDLYYRTVIMKPYRTIHDAWADLQRYGLSNRSDGPSWRDARDFVDFEAWEAMWEAELSLPYSASYPLLMVPIRRSQAARFRDLEEGRLLLPAGPRPDDGGEGSGGDVGGGEEVE